MMNTDTDTRHSQRLVNSSFLIHHSSFFI